MAGTGMKPVRSCMQAAGTRMKPAKNHMQMANQGRIGKKPYENGEPEWNQQELHANSRNWDQTSELEWNQQWTVWKWRTRGYLAKTAYENNKNSKKIVVKKVHETSGKWQ